METDEYQKLASLEDRMGYFQSLHAHVWRELRRRLPTQAHILDAGCGTGGLIRRLTPLGPKCQWTGVDLSPLACELASTRCEADIRVASVTSLPFAEGRFDAVVSADVLYHVDDDRAALRELYRVLRPGGVIVINLPAYPWLWSYHDEATHARRRYSRSEVEEKLRAVGFSLMRVTHWNALFLPLTMIRRKLLPAPRGGSDVDDHPALIEGAFKAAMTCERAWLRTGMNLGWGSSILAVGSKTIVS